MSAGVKYVEMDLCARKQRPAGLPSRPAGLLLCQKPAGLFQWVENSPNTKNIKAQDGFAAEIPEDGLSGPKLGPYSTSTAPVKKPT